MGPLTALEMTLHHSRRELVKALIKNTVIPAYRNYNTIIIYTVYEPKTYNEAINVSHSPL